MQRESNLRFIQQKILFFVSIIVIAVINLYDIDSLYAITIIDDEFGYVGMAAQMAGYDWTGLLGVTDFYSYGYGILLSLLFRIGLTGVSFFRAAVILNVIFLILSFCITYYLTNEIIDCKYNVLIALAINLYCSNIFQCRICWVETLLYFLVWVLMLLIYQLNKSYELRYLLEIMIVSVYMYVVHQRCLSVIIVAIIMSIVILLSHSGDRKNVYKLLVSFVVLFMLMMIATGAKDYIVSNWYVAKVFDRRIAVNDYFGQVNKLKRLGNIKMFISNVLGMFGKLYSQAVASCMLILIALAVSIKIWIKKSIWVIKEKRVNLEQSEMFVLTAGLLFLGALVVATIYKSNNLSNQRYYEIIMTRYIDYATGPMLLLGVYSIIKMKEYTKEIVLTFITMIGLTVLTYLQFLKSNHPMMHRVNIASVYSLVKNAPNDLKTILLAGIIAALIAIMLLVLLHVGERMGKQDIAIGCIAAIMICIFSYNGITEEREYLIMEKQDEVVRYVQPVANYLKDNVGEQKIYCMEGTVEYNYLFVKMLQFLIPEYKVELISEKEIKDNMINDNYFLIVGSDYKIEELDEKLVAETDRLCLYSQ